MQKIASTPAKHRLYAVGDIHGRLDLLTRLLAEIEADAAKHPDKKKKLIFLGDYVDRGLDSKGVINRLLGNFAAELEPHFIGGNHDDMFRRFLEGETGLAAGWLQLGGAAALASYGVNPYGASVASKLPALREELLRKVPADHRTFLENLISSATYGDYYFVHAGVKPGVPLPLQKVEDQMWIRGAFLNSKEDFGKIIVHGHTILTKPDVLPNRIGIDTGAFASGHLTCLILDGTEQIFLST